MLLLAGFDSAAEPTTTTATKSVAPQAANPVVFFDVEIVSQYVAFLSSKETKEGCQQVQFGPVKISKTHGQKGNVHKFNAGPIQAKRQKGGKSTSTGEEH